MTKHNLTLPVWQSRVLLAAGFAAFLAAELGAGVYAFQSASASQEVWGIPTDAALKTVLSVAAGLGVALGAAVAAWLWRTGRKGLRKQAYLAMVITAWALFVSVGNLSGYFGWTRAQREVEAVTTNPLYAVAAANAQAVVEGRAPYLTGADRRLLMDGQANADAQREAGDVSKALAVHLLILGFGTAYRLPTPTKRRRRNAKTRAEGKPKLAVVK